MPRTELADADFIVLNHDQLDAFVELVGGPNQLTDDDELLIFTDDEHTRGRSELNLISFDADAFSDPDREYGIATQLHHPVGPTDTALDLRQGRSDDQRL